MVSIVDAPASRGPSFASSCIKDLALPDTSDKYPVLGRHGKGSQVLVRGMVMAYDEPDMDDVMSKLAKYWMSGGLGEAISNFVTENYVLFDDNAGEHQHEYHELYENYTALLEAKLEAFLEENEVPAEEFYLHCKEVIESGKKEGTFIPFILSAIDYETFANTIYEFKNIADFPFGDFAMDF